MLFSLPSLDGQAAIPNERRRETLPALFEQPQLFVNGASWDWYAARSRVLS